MGDELEIEALTMEYVSGRLLDLATREAELDDELIARVLRVRDEVRSVSRLLQHRSDIADQIEREWYGWPDETPA